MTQVPKVRSRRRVALLFDAISDDYQASIVRGAASAALQADIELVCLAGGVIGDGAGDERTLRNFLFELMDVSDFDGILSLSGPLGNAMGASALSSWIQRFAPLPIVSLGVELSSCHNIVVDGVSGMRDTLLHLIRTHHHRRIAFIRGPATSVEAEERYGAYREVLAEAGISEDPLLVLSGDWLSESGAAAVSELFEHRRVKVDAVDAIACANDYMALGAMMALRSRGISVPGNVAVTGFDDIDQGKYAVPPLTTVQQPTDALGREGIQRLVALMEGTDAPKLSRLSTVAIGRRSCGCARTDVLLRRSKSAREGRSFHAAVLERRELILAELSRSARGGLAGVGPHWEQRLLSAALAELTGGEQGKFLTAVDHLMASLHMARGELAQAQSVLTALRGALQDCARSEQDAVARVDDLLDLARELIGEWLLREEAHKRTDVVGFLRDLTRVSAVLLSRRSVQEQRHALEDGLRRLGLTALSVGLFSESGRVSPQCQCLVAFEPSGRARPESFFRSSDFSPTSVFTNARAPVLVQPLTYEREPMGLLAFALGTQQGGVYEQMRQTFGIALRGFRLAADAAGT